MRENWMERLDLPGEPGPTQSVIEIVGTGRVLIEHHSGVVQYGTRQICVKVRYGIVEICGQDLELKRMTGQMLVISGCIDSVRLERRGRG